MARRKGILGIINDIAQEAERNERRRERIIMREYNQQIRENQRLLKEIEKERRMQEKQRLLQQKEKAISYAAHETQNSTDLRNSLTNIIKESLTQPITLNWDKCKNLVPFKEPEPVKPCLFPYPNEIDRSQYTPKIPFIFHFLKSKKQKIIDEYEKLFMDAIEARNLEVKKIDLENDKILKKFQKEHDQWLSRKKKYQSEADTHNKFIDLSKINFKNKESNAIELYFFYLISNFSIPQDLKIEWKISYDQETKILVIDYNLPEIDIIPKLKTMRYIASRKEFSETYIKDSVINKIYHDMILQTCLRITNDIYVCDTFNYVDSIVFNGIHNGINKSTGLRETKCILSLQTQKEEFLNINIQQVEAKACFKKFKGFSGVDISELVPVAPILQFDKDDSRFISPLNIEDSINGQNIAAMNWEDFEHLIRELFEKEFAINGAEIKITQASRDGGVDAVMFDPDPIRGGKYIIQAKRYTNVVGVSAVRDLYGTLMNEGAVKGILVTTAKYGSDSYEFAKDKPITLIDGSNLLSMLGKHGYKTYIDIEEAKSRVSKL